MEVLVDFFDKDVMLYGDPNRNSLLKEMLVELRLDLCQLAWRKQLHAWLDRYPSIAVFKY